MYHGMLTLNDPKRSETIEVIELAALDELRRENQEYHDAMVATREHSIMVIQELQAKLAECEAELVRLKDDLISYCSFCTFEAPVGTTSFADLQAHVKVCEFHPLNKKISMRDKQLAIAKKTLSNIMRGPCCLICECHSCNAKKALNEIESMETDHDQAK